MRLIDADVFKTEYENLITWVSHRAEKARLREFIKDIQNQPTVKAIPVEWLKRYEIIKGQEVRLQDAINEWEKENETN
jgi:hypothetical protein